MILTIIEPDPTKVRTWTDRSKSFSVEAQFLALKDGKINLHKMNGVKIAVPVAKMSVSDLEYVERITGISLDEDKPLSDIKRQQARGQSEGNSSSAPTAQVGATIEKPEYDWFPFFLACDVPVGMCERYAQIFNKGSIDESVLPDVDASVLRNLGIREGDIIKIMRNLDSKYNRKKRDANGTSEDGGDGGLFSGPGGSLKNNTRKGRPAPSVQTNDIVDAKAFSRQDEVQAQSSTQAPASSAAAITSAKNSLTGGFDDDAWEVKPGKAISPAPAPTPAAVVAPPSQPPRQQAPALTGSMRELSLLDSPLQPTKIETPQAPPMIQQPIPQAAPPQQPQQTGATPGFFTTLNQQQTGVQNQQFLPQQTGYGQQQQMPQNIARQRPMAPQYTQNTSSLMIPPPPRPLSAPQAPQQSGFGPPPPLQPQMTGVPNAGFQSSIAPPGQSLNEINQMRMQQQYGQQQQQLQPQMTGFGQSTGLMAQPTGYNQFMNQQPNSFGQMQPQQTGFGQQLPGQSPFADPRGGQFSPIQSQPTGFQSQFGQQQFGQPTGINSFLPPPLQPQPTGMPQVQQTPANGFSQGFGTPQQQTPAPLVPQKTGPPPPVRFGVAGDTKKLMPQATGRRANLAQASKLSL